LDRRRGIRQAGLQPAGPAESGSAGWKPAPLGDDGSSRTNSPWYFARAVRRDRRGGLLWLCRRRSKCCQWRCRSDWRRRRGGRILAAYHPRMAARNCGRCCRLAPRLAGWAIGPPARCEGSARAIWRADRRLTRRPVQCLRSALEGRSAGPSATPNPRTHSAPDAVDRT
jgi:hypothetical protein